MQYWVPVEGNSLYLLDAFKELVAFCELIQQLLAATDLQDAWCRLGSLHCLQHSACLATATCPRCKYNTTADQLHGSRRFHPRPCSGTQQILLHVQMPALVMATIGAWPLIGLP